jgi:hypothetical protein
MPASTQSAGDPSTENFRLDIFEIIMGFVNVIQCATPDCSVAGATTQTSPFAPAISIAISSKILKPGAFIPSSLVTKIRITYLIIFGGLLRTIRFLSNWFTL